MLLDKAYEDASTNHDSDEEDEEIDVGETSVRRVSASRGYYTVPSAPGDRTSVV